jgi:hypothetical protein
VACGREHSLFVAEPYGYVYACGAGFGGRLALPPVGRDDLSLSDPDATEPTLAGAPWTTYPTVLLDPTVLLAPPPPCSALAPPLLRGARAVAAGDLHSLALLPCGRVLSWGFPDSGALGRPHSAEDLRVPLPVELPAQDPAVAVACGAYHSLACAASGRVHSWGDGADGQLGYPAAEPAATPRPVAPFGPDLPATSVAAGFCTSGCVAKGSLYLWGDPAGQDGQPLGEAPHVPKDATPPGGVVEGLSLGG